MENFMTEQVLNGAGLAGVALYLGSYALLHTGFLRGSGFAYAVLNLCAASLVLLSLIEEFNLSSAIIQISWIIISLFGIARLAWLNSRVRFSVEERTMLHQMFPDMPPAIARTFLNRGNWIDAEEGAVLIEEAQPVVNLYYIADGQVQITSGEQVVGTVESGFLGEMNVLSGGPASATVQVLSPSRLFLISGAALQALAARDSDFRLLLENGMNRDTGRKLMRANQRMSADAGATT